MAYAVDAGGKKTATNGGGGINPSGTGAAALLRDIQGDRPFIPTSTGGRSLAADLAEASGTSYGSDSWGWSPTYDYSSTQSSYVPTGVPQTPYVAQQPVMMPAATSRQQASMSYQPAQLTATAPAGTAASPGGKVQTQANPITIEDVKGAFGPSANAGLDVWEQQRAEAERRPVRQVNMFGEEFDDDDDLAKRAMVNWLDPQYANVGNTPTNDAYLRYWVMNNDMTEDQARQMLNGKPLTMEGIKAMSERGNTDMYNQMSHRNSVIDDGTSFDYDHLTSDKMTGVQYMRYRDDLGMGGRTGYIDPSAVYSKRDEALNNNFIPFMPDRDTYADQVIGNVLDAPGQIGKSIGNLRQTITPDYEIAYTDSATGKQRTISGKAFDEVAGPFMSLFNWNQQFRPTELLSPGPNKTAMVTEYVVPDVNGRDTYHYGHMTGIDGNLDTGQIVMSFSDGTKVDVSQDYLDSMTDQNGFINLPANNRVPFSKINGDAEAIVKTIQENETQQLPIRDSNDLYQADIIYYPQMEMPDGSFMDLADVERLLYDKTPENDSSDDMYGLSDDDVSYRFGGLGPITSRPSRLGGQEIFTDNGIDLSNAMNDVVDWTLGSIPISAGNSVPFVKDSLGNYVKSPATWPLPWIYALSNAKQSMAGIDPNSYDPVQGTYGLIAGNYDEQGRPRYGVFDYDPETESWNRDEQRSDETKYWNTMGNMLVPLTEMLVGPVGESIIPLEKLVEKAPIKSALGKIAANALAGSAAEGVEEVLGNIFEDWTQYGTGGMFADKMIDENGDPITDLYGHEVRDYDTPVYKRGNNYLSDMQGNANAFAGGVGVSALMGLPGLAFGGMRDIGNAAATDLGRWRARSTGVRDFVDPRSIGDSVDEEYASLFKRSGMIGD